MRSRCHKLASRGGLLEYCAKLKRREDAVRPPELEPELWRLAVAVYGQCLCGIVREALGRYRRRPGHDDMTRIYRSNVGLEGFSILRECLINDP